MVLIRADEKDPKKGKKKFKRVHANPTIWESTRLRSPLPKLVSKNGGYLKHHGDKFVRDANKYTLM
jgi:hypothetical protein